MFSSYKLLGKIFRKENPSKKMCHCQASPRKFQIHSTVKIHDHMKEKKQKKIQILTCAFFSIYLTQNALKNIITFKI